MKESLKFDKTQIKDLAPFSLRKNLLTPILIVNKSNMLSMLKVKLIIPIESQLIKKI